MLLQTRFYFKYCHSTPIQHWEQRNTLLKTRITSRTQLLQIAQQLIWGIRFKALAGQTFYVKNRQNNKQWIVVTHMEIMCMFSGWFSGVEGPQNWTNFSQLLPIILPNYGEMLNIHNCLLIMLKDRDYAAASGKRVMVLKQITNASIRWKTLFNPHNIDIRYHLIMQYGVWLDPRPRFTICTYWNETDCLHLLYISYLTSFTWQSIWTRIRKVPLQHLENFSVIWAKIKWPSEPNEQDIHYPITSFIFLIES